MQTLQESETPYFYIHRVGGMGAVHNEITHPPYSLDEPQLAEIADLSAYRLRKKASPHTRENELAEHDFTFMLMAQNILGEQKDLPEDFIEPLNKVMSKVGKNNPSKPRF